MAGERRIERGPNYGVTTVGGPIFSRRVQNRPAGMPCKRFSEHATILGPGVYGRLEAIREQAIVPGADYHRLGSNGWCGWSALSARYPNALLTMVQKNHPTLIINIFDNHLPKSR